ncbi:MAG: LPS export ABC transporter permease LptG [Thiopseudomonas sp.]|nr:LPS export ABC transporter permease LptG [Thiopseudomonas sp.]
MRKLDLYVGRTVLSAIVAVLLVITGLAVLFAFIDQLSELEGSYTLKEALIYVGLTTPRRLYDVLPMSALIGCLVGLGSMASSSELTVMRAAGISLSRIVWAVMKPLLLLMALGLVIAEYVAPWTEVQAQARRSLIQAEGKTQSTRHGMWHRQGQEYIHINSVQPDGRLIGVTRYEFDDERRLQRASFARQAHFVAADQWQLKNVVATRLHAQSSEVEQLKEERWDIALTPELLNTVVMEPDALPISGLWGYARYLSEQGLNAGRYWLAFWSKLLQPVVTGVLVLMAISFIFGPLRSVTLGQRLFTGVLVGFVFRIMQDLLGPASLVFGFAPLLAVLVPAGVCAVIGFWLLRRAG